MFLRRLLILLFLMTFIATACDDKQSAENAENAETDMGSDVSVLSDVNPSKDVQSADAKLNPESGIAGDVDSGTQLIDSGDDVGIIKPGEPLLKNVKNYIFGHSLIVHSPPAIATPSDETTVPHWMHLLSQDAGYDYSVSGQYGFLMQHDDLPPRAQWGFDIVPTAWDPDETGDSFEDVNFTTILLTAGNFIQYKPSSEPYDGDNPDNTTPVSATLDIVSWVTNAEPGIKVYIYENWPDMGGYLGGGFPPSPTELTNYNNYVVGDFHQWWLDYHDAVLGEVAVSNLNVEVKMIPVGPILTKLLTAAPFSAIPITELYEDDAPHGRPTLYFLASLVTYMAIYGIQTPASYEVPTIIHSTVRDNYSDIVTMIWNELNAFKDSSGKSRVF